MSSSYNELKKNVQQALAQVCIMVDIVKNDLRWCRDKAVNTILPHLLRELMEKEKQVCILIVPSKVFLYLFFLLHNLKLSIIVLSDD